MPVFDQSGVSPETTESTERAARLNRSRRSYPGATAYADGITSPDKGVSAIDSL